MTSATVDDGELTPADWQIRLDARRGGRPVDAAALDDLRRQFRQITVQTRSLLHSPWLARPEAAALNRPAQRALQLSRLAFAELERFDLSAGSAAAPEIVGELLKANAAELETIDDQFWLLAWVHRISEELHPLADELTHGVENAARRLLRLAETLLEERDVRPRMAAWLPSVGVSPAESLRRVGWNRSEWFPQAALSARLLAAHAADWLRLLPSELPTLVAAALVQDLGLWTAAAQAGGLEKRAPLHPAAGAALLAGRRDAPVELSLLVGAHHERIDGSGYPQRLSGRRLPLTAQGLGLVARWVELSLSRAVSQAADEADEPLWLHVGLNLWREVRRGGFDTALAQGWLERLRPGMAAAVAAELSRRLRHAVDTAHGAPQPHAWSRRSAGAAEASGAGQVVDAPRYLRRSRGGDRRGVLIAQPSAREPS